MSVHNPRFPLVDSLRALAALSIFAYHIVFHLRLLRDSSLLDWAGQLNIGVPIFFVISGFLLYRPFASARAAGDAPPPLIPYAVRRALRIVPAYWVALTIVALVLGLSYVFTVRGIVTYYGFLQIYDKDTIINGIGPAWTLCVEVTFYAALPLWALLMRRVRGRFLATELVMLAGVAALSLGWKAVVLYVVPADTPGWLPAQIVLPAFADHFALGMALAALSVAGARGLQLVDAAPWLPWALAAGAFALLPLGVPGQQFEAGSLWQHELRGLIGALVLLPAVAGDPARGWVRRALAWPWLLWLGAISYGFYLWHLPVILELQQRGWMESPGRLALGVTAFVATVLVAAASWYLVERPALRRGRRRFGLRGSDEVERPVAAKA